MLKQQPINFGKIANHASQKNIHIVTSKLH